MTWKNLPCAPTLPALFAACPNGWAELVLASHPGNPTADPPQDADSSVELGRIYGVDHSDLFLLDDLANDLNGEHPAGLPSDCTVLVRFSHGAPVCMICKQLKADGDTWTCSKPGCDGIYMVPTRAELTWGPDKTIPHFIGEDTPAYAVDPREKHWTPERDERLRRMVAIARETAPVHGIDASMDAADIIEKLIAKLRPAVGELPPQPGVGDMWQQVIERYVDSGTNSAVFDIFRKRREMGLAKYGTPLQAGNGRNPLRDLLDETLDRIVYIEQAITEVPGRAASLHTEQDNDIELVEVLLGMQGFEDTGEQCRAAYLRSIDAPNTIDDAAADLVDCVACGDTICGPSDSPGTCRQIRDRGEG